MSRKQNTIDGILAIGYKEQYRSNKYRCFQRPNSNQCLLVGKSGALRVTKSTIARSFSLTGTKHHLAYAHVGELSRRQELTPEEALSAWRNFYHA